MNFISEPCFSPADSEAFLSLSLSLVSIDQEAPQVTGKSHQDVRGYVRHISVIDNQRTLSQLSHRIEPRRSWCFSAALPLPVNKLALYMSVYPVKHVSAQGLSVLWLVVWTRGLVSVFACRAFGPLLLTFVVIFCHRSDGVLEFGFDWKWKKSSKAYVLWQLFWDLFLCFEWFWACWSYTTIQKFEVSKIFCLFFDAGRMY